MKKPTQWSASAIAVTLPIRVIYSVSRDVMTSDPIWRGHDIWPALSPRRAFCKWNPSWSPLKRQLDGPEVSAGCGLTPPQSLIRARSDGIIANLVQPLGGALTKVVISSNDQRKLPALNLTSTLFQHICSWPSGTPALSLHLMVECCHPILGTIH